MTIEPVRSKRRPVLIVLTIALVLALIASVTVISLTTTAAQQRKESLVRLKDERLTALVEARGKIQPAVNTYLAAYKKARNAPASLEEAEKSSAKERDEFQQTINSARAALTEVQGGNTAGSEEDTVPEAVALLSDSYQAYLESMEGLVDSYPLFEGLFRQDAGCSGLFVGSKAANLRERQTLLAQAAVPCREAVNQLKQSKNVAYVEFARTLDNEIAQLESHAETTAKSEENYNEFVRLKDEYVKKIDEATARNAPDAEYLKLADELKALNTRIKNNRSEFDFAAKRYLNGVRDMPTLVEEVFSKNVSDHIKHHDAVIPIRVQVLKDAIDADLAE
ncbi:hypothetical protein [Paenarthrobacter aurescens]|uniref:Uncharacterized protein n=1 Tax=Paenarthrobacter aurescens TaxID=43663 RepID=A0A4Y3NG24_PAEAU|nr:hypothetical protein [Paenarthrobacter aurescens]MDO6142610.1 hypothetical protein [Paenarthrobacter aurescens]MDO6146457.1 hypothetical protein [Paenarthrobacter aurescens]MDO6157702.1 hypothetical protein [Paenarthrobacter aurescens]MDO6161687.1 hypothetical protein [Paenarthrobacter aurescens]GEB20770.1 hypothetical protein AAU01_35250 [Paenarthrobacter aurescens]